MQIDEASAKNPTAPHPDQVSHNQPLEISARAEKKPRGRKQLITFVVCGLVVLGALWGVAKHRAAAANKAAASALRGGQPPVPVVSGTVVKKDVPIYLDGLGTVYAFNTVTVHARVDGQLINISFVEGQDVKAGDLLAQIDPDPYRTQMQQNEGKKGQDEAQLANARVQLNRDAELLAQKVLAQQDYDTQKALVDQLEAAVKADQAAIDSAKVQLAYTTITSPIDGRIGIRLVDQGNIVHANDANGLVVITQLRPVSVVFTLTENTLGDIQKQMLLGSLAVLAVGPDNSTVLGEGKLAVIDNQIDTTTGTIKLKATFPNNDLRLWPGQFVNARLLLTTHKDGTVVPASVIQRGPEGAYAFVIEDNKIDNKGIKDSAGNQASRADTDRKSGMGNKTKGKTDTNSAPDNLTVRLQPVSGIHTEAGEALVDTGLHPGERVVVDGQYKLQAGSRVRLTPTTKAAEGDSGGKDSTQ